MPQLVWSKPGDRQFESGLDRGVLYLPDGTAVPWNGLVSITEKFAKERQSVYYDGRKISDLMTAGEFSATLRAITVPEEFFEIDGMTSLRRGVLLGEQPPQTFGLSYRTQISNEAKPIVGHKLHIVWNLTAIPSDRERVTASNDPSLMELEWDLASVPEDVPGFRPTAQIILESHKIDPWLLEEIEAWLYGSTITAPELPPLRDFVQFMDEWARVTITDNGDGTWTAVERRPGFIFVSDDGSGDFEMVRVNVSYLGEGEFILRDTKEDVGTTQIIDNMDGTWSATSENESVIQVVDGEFTIYDIDPVLSGPDFFRLATT